MDLTIFKSILTLRDTVERSRRAAPEAAAGTGDTGDGARPTTQEDSTVEDIVRQSLALRDEVQAALDEAAASPGDEIGDILRAAAAPLDRPVE